jgi:hypothetical protein
MAMAAVLFSQGQVEKAIFLAEAALQIERRFGEVEILKKNLWGERMIAAAQSLLANPRLQTVLR